ncbi:MAG: ImmA/IrrE family metallo-endopeptidase [Atopobiaceae bacterium]|nr:ImmA/IrrE family metallo-endopeptidase [Atopobiaceae bacterium]
MIFPADRYYIERAAEQLMEDMGLWRYPIKVMDVLQWMGVPLTPYSSFEKQERGEIMQASPDAFLAMRGSQSEVFYNDGICRCTRIRFSIAHEIGHIWLGHREQTPKNERSANYFAGYLLAPHPLIIAHGLWSDVATSMWLSERCAKFAHDQAKARWAEKRPFTSHERAIVGMIREIGVLPCSAVA